VLPRISIVTATLNQGAFIETTLRSILDQEYPGLEHIVIDGGSTDNTAAVLDAYRPHISAIVSEKDDGQYHAINKGLAMCAGEVMAWLNSDDIYEPGALRVIGEIFEKFPQIEWLTTRSPKVIDATGNVIEVGSIYGFTRSGFCHGDNLPGCGWRAVGFIQQESTFWRRSLWERAGGSLDLNYRLAADFELWARFFRHAQLYSVALPLGSFRRQPAQRSSLSSQQYLQEAKSILLQSGGRPRPRPLQRASIKICQSKQRAIRKLMLKSGLVEAAPIVVPDAAGGWSLGEA
jgi:glycosyltransferase involved in cell wall biosynthesis